MNTEDNYGTKVSIEELEGHYKTHFLKPSLFIDLVKEWHEQEVKNLTIPVVIRQSEQLFCDTCNTEMSLVDNDSYYGCKNCGYTRAK